MSREQNGLPYVTQLDLDFLGLRTADNISPHRDGGWSTGQIFTTP